MELPRLNPLDYGSLEFFTQLVRYFGFAGGAYLLLKRLPRFLPQKIDLREARVGQARYEIRHSLSTIVIFSMNAVLGFLAHLHWGWFRFYDRIEDHGWTYFVLSPILIVLFHDTYFYWTHRAMHHPRLFRIFHRVHHQSSSPTPLTIYSFHPLEAFLESLFIPLLAIFLPIHMLAIPIFLVITFSMNLIGHLGYEFYGPGFWRSRMSEILTTTTYHHFHHGSPKYNYGFYFRFWDRVCGTEDPRYQDVIEARRRDASEISGEVTSHEPRELAG